MSIERQKKIQMKKRHREGDVEIGILATTRSWKRERQILPLSLQSKRGPVVTLVLAQ